MVLGDWINSLDRALEQLKQGNLESFSSFADWKRVLEADAQTNVGGEGKDNG